MDKLIVSKNIYTVTNGLIDGAIGITGERISYVGPVDDAEPTPDTEVIDLGDQFVKLGAVSVILLDHTVFSEDHIGVQTFLASKLTSHRVLQLRLKVLGHGCRVVDTNAPRRACMTSC